MNKIRLAINGFGRIGRSAFKIAWERPEIETVAVNDLTDNDTLAGLLNYDSNYGRWKHKVKATDQGLAIADEEVRVLSEKDPAQLPWKELNVDVVIESTGVFTEREKAALHLKAGAKKVIISAPSKGDNPAPIYVLGANQTGKEDVISNASCTTNCIAPVMKILEIGLGIEGALMTTVHAYTPDQNLQDGPHKDLRRARAAAVNIVPTTTGAAVAATKTLPSIKGKFDGIAIRVPVAVGSISDITALVKKGTSVEEVNRLFKKAAGQPQYKGILEVTEEPLVSSDVVGTTASAIVDLGLTKVIGNLVKVFAWYDNEHAYSVRLVEQIIVIGKQLLQSSHSS
jgi:glyceraldehyde 3-phosphate dehydrogenase